MKSGVLASTARLRSTRNTTSSPSLRSSASRTRLGIVICPFDVKRAAASIAFSLLKQKCKDNIAVGRTKTKDRTKAEDKKWPEHSQQTQTAGRASGRRVSKGASRASRWR